MVSPTDEQLLKTFAKEGDEVAFAELVRRHGPLVFGLCHRVLRNPADAEDAAQAAFLALARHAQEKRTIRSTAAWLHRVAHNLALNVLKSRRARERCDKEAGAMIPPADRPAPLSAEQCALLHEEIDALPEKHREAVILFHLQEKSLEEAASIMACPSATLGTWVARGRERLKDRLSRRGLVLSMAALTSLLSTEAGAVELPVTFVAATTKAAALFVVGKAGAGLGASALSSHVASLAEGALKNMFYAKLRMVVVMVVLFLSIGAGGGWLVNRAMSADKVETPPHFVKPDVDAPPHFGEPDIVGYILLVEKGRFLVTGQGEGGGDTAVWYSFEKAEKVHRIGEQVKVWSLAMDESYPGQAKAERIEVLDVKKPEKALLTRAEAVQKALGDLAPGPDLFVTFVRRATFDADAQAWKISINVGKENVGRGGAGRVVDIEVRGDGQTVRKRDIAEREPPAQSEPDRLVTDKEAFDNDAATIAAQYGMSKDEAASLMKAQAALDDVVTKITTAFPNAYTGAIMARGPADEPRIFIKGPATREVREMVGRAPVRIRIVDNQPYSEAELKALQDQVYMELEKQGFQDLLCRTEMGPPCRIHATVQMREGLPRTVEGVLKLLPPKVASGLELKLQPGPVIGPFVPE